MYYANQKWKGLFMKYLIFILMTFIMISISSCGNLLYIENENVISKKSEDLLDKAELIDKKNRHLIGSEVIDFNPPQIMINSSNKTDNKSIEGIDELENSIVLELADDSILIPSSITNFETINGISPEIIMPNGSAVIFTQEKLNGWTCKVGDKLIYEFEKYESNVSSLQTIIIGYVLNGILYPGEEFKELSGTYQFEIVEEGGYHIYIISATSDYLALKQGTINIVSNE